MRYLANFSISLISSSLPPLVFVLESEKKKKKAAFDRIAPIGKLWTLIDTCCLQYVPSPFCL